VLGVGGGEGEDSLFICRGDPVEPTNGMSVDRRVVVLLPAGILG